MVRTVGTQWNGDTREVIDSNDKSLQNQINQIVLDDGSVLELAQARVATNGTDHETLKARLDYEYVLLDTGKIARSEFDERLSNLIDGSPKGVFSTLTDLENAYPNGAEGVYLVQSDGNWYVYDESTGNWISGGVYQSSDFADGGVQPNKIAKNFNMLQGQYITEGQMFAGVTSEEPYELAFSTNEDYFTGKIPCPDTGRLVIYRPDLSSGHAAGLEKEDGTAYETYVGRWVTNTPGSTLEDWLVVYDDYYIIDVDQMLRRYPDVAYIVFGFNTSDLTPAYVNGEKVYGISEFKWFSNDLVNDTENIRNNAVTMSKIAEQYNMIKDSTILKQTYAAGYNSETGEVVNGEDPDYFLAVLAIPDSGLLRVFTSDLGRGQFLVLIDGEGLGLSIVRWDSTSDTSYMKRYDGYVEINISDLKVNYPTVSSLQVEFLTEDFEEAYINGIAVKSFEWQREENGKQFVLPSHVPCVENKQFNVYLDNILKYGNFYTADKYIVRNQGNIIEGAYQTDSVYDQTLTFQYFNGKHVEKQASLDVKQVPSSAGDSVTKRAIIIGESTTATDDFIGEIVNLFNSDVMNIELLGTRGTAPNLREGRPGWTTDDYINLAERQGIPNAFYNPTTETFDFSYYMSEQGYSSVDYVCFNMGINDIAQDYSIEETLNNYDTIISSIKNYDANIKVFVGLTNLSSRFPNISQANNGFKDKVLELIDALIDEYGDRENEGYFLTPIYLWLDPFWDMRYDEQPISARNTKTTFIGTDGVHPSEIGYAKQADIHFNLFKYVAYLEQN